MALDQWEPVWLPRRPLATDDLQAGIWRQARPEALHRRYIEANPQAMSNLLVVDCDHHDAALRALSSVGDHPIPNAIIENPANGHAHAVWALAEPITRTEYARRKPLAYAASVTEGLRRSLDGDKGYSGLMTKNPLNESWGALWCRDELYTLDELATRLDAYMPPANWRQQRARKANPVGLGRNCTLFDSARVWAYREARRIRQRHEHATTEDAAALAMAINNEITARNACFSDPLPRSEATGIARSINRWITTRFYGWTDSRAVSQATFITIQSARSQRAVAKRKAARANRIEEVFNS